MELHFLLYYEDYGGENVKYNPDELSRVMFSYVIYALLLLSFSCVIYETQITDTW